MLRSGKHSWLYLETSNPWHSRPNGLKSISLFGASLHFRCTFDTVASNLCTARGLKRPFFLRFSTRTLASLGFSWRNSLVCLNSGLYYVLNSEIHGFSIQRLIDLYIFSRISFASMASFCEQTRFSHFSNFCGLFALLAFYKYLRAFLIFITIISRDNFH